VRRSPAELDPAAVFVAAVVAALDGFAQRLLKNGDVGGMRHGLGLAAGVGDAGENAASVVVADVAADKAVVLEALDEAGKGALAQMNLLGELLDAAVPLWRVREAAKDLVFGEGEAVLSLEAVLEGLANAGVLGLELIPAV
jgi:hypothetical protein